MRREKTKLITITPGMIASAVSASRQFSDHQHRHGDDQPDDRDRRRDDRHLQQAGRRVDVAGETRQDAAGLHVPQLRQRQVQQPVEQRPPQRQHDPHVQQALAVVLEDADARSRGRSRATNTRAGEVQARQARGAVERRVQQHAVDDEPHEERLDHLEPGDDQREQEEHADRVAVRPQPAQVIAQVFAPLAGCLRLVRGVPPAFGFFSPSAGSSSVRSL